MVKLWFWFFLVAGPASMIGLVWFSWNTGVMLGYNGLIRQTEEPTRFWISFVVSVLAAAAIIVLSITMIADCTLPAGLGISTRCRLW